MAYNLLHMAPLRSDEEDTNPGKFSLKSLQEMQERLEHNEQLNLSKRLANTEVRLTQLSMEVQEALVRMTAGLNLISRDASDAASHNLDLISTLTAKLACLVDDVKDLHGAVGPVPLPPDAS